MAAQNCWEFKKCGREEGGAKAKELGVCIAYPNHGRDCWIVTGTLCGGQVQGTFAQKLKNCKACEFYKLASLSEVIVSMLALELGPSAPHLFARQCKVYLKKEPEKISVDDLDQVASSIYTGIKDILADEKMAGKVKEEILQMKVH